MTQEKTRYSIDELDPEGLAEYLLFQVYFSGGSLIKGRPAVDPITVNRRPPRDDLSWQDYKDGTERAVVESVRRAIDGWPHPQVCVSGGVDSSTVAAVAHALHGPIDGWIGFFELDGYSEVEHAEALFEWFGKDSDLFAVEITQDAWVDAIRPAIAALRFPMCGPGAVSQWLVAEQASGNTNMLLTGEGGDELFGGYVRYVVYDALRRLRGLEAYRPAVQAFVPDIAMELPDIYHRLVRRQDKPCPPGFRGAFFACDCDPMLFDTSHALAHIVTLDRRMAEAHSITAIAPLSDQSVIDYAHSIPVHMRISDGGTKRILREAFRGWMPECITDRKDKMGFPAPFVKWYREGGRLRDFVVDTLTSTEAKTRPCADYYKHALDTNEAEFGRTIWAALSLELWFREYIDAVS